MNINDLEVGGHVRLTQTYHVQVQFMDGAEICDIPEGTEIKISDITREKGKVVSVKVTFAIRSSHGVNKIHTTTFTRPQDFLEPIKPPTGITKGSGEEPVFSW